MKNLLSLYFTRILKSKYFYIMAIIVLAFPVISATLLGDEGDVSATFTMALVFMPMIIAAFTGLFVDPEFTHNTIRNSMIKGYKRQQVYISFFIPVATVSVLFMVLYAISTFAVSAVTDGIENISAKATITVILVSIILMITSSALSLLICMVIHGAKCLVLVILFQYTFMFLSILNQPSSNEVSILARFIPQSIYGTLNFYQMPDKPLLTVLCTLLLCLAVNALSIYHFKDIDLP
ncbi:MAG: ABC transporter permease subunit [Ruminococcus sp.]|mgnify:FL=1|nr:ABC transporter permease subunit [Ruminococcus sp.]